MDGKVLVGGSVHGVLRLYVGVVIVELGCFDEYHLDVK